MLDDHAAAYGRQTNWKWIMALVLLAVLALAGALWARSGAPLPHWRGKQSPMDWRELPWSDGEALVEVASGVLGIAPDRLWYMDQSGAITAKVEAEGENFLPISGVPGAWGKTAGYVWDGGFRRISVSGEILHCSGSTDALAVTASASGCYTRTTIMTRTGETLGQVIPAGAAMVETALTENRMAGLTLDEAGQWSLHVYELSGRELFTLRLPAGETYHIKAMENRIALLGDHALTIYDDAGAQTGVFRWQRGVPVLWDADSHWAAVLLEDSGSFTLNTLDANGTLLGSGTAAGPLRSLRAAGNRLYALDYQTLQVYDTLCTSLGREECGARAAAMAPADGAVWLLGNGEIARISTK